MFNFEYYAHTRVIFGRDAEQRTGALLRELGVSRVLIHYGGGSAVKSGLLDRVSASLDGAGIAHTSLGGVVPNPRVSKVREGAKLARLLVKEDRWTVLCKMEEIGGYLDG